jgi:hypothetical protein
VRAGGYIFSMEKETKTINWEQDFICTPQNNILYIIYYIDFVSDRMSYIDLGRRWCNIVVFNMHAPREKKSDDSEDFRGGFRSLF